LGHFKKKQKLSHDKIIFHMLFEAFHNNARILWLGLGSKMIRLGSVSITRGEAILEIKIAKVLNKQKQIQNVVTKSVHFSRLSCRVR